VSHLKQDWAFRSNMKKVTNKWTWSSLCDWSARALAITATHIGFYSPYASSGLHYASSQFADCSKAGLMCQLPDRKSRVFCPSISSWARNHRSP
jgi:hypothetical protein